MKKITNTYMTEKELKAAMSALYKKSKEMPVEKLIGAAVNLGMKYQLEKIKEGMDVVFKELQ